jgi:hypothetical protein
LTYLRDLTGNILAGARLALMLPVRRGAFWVSLDQAVSLLFLGFALSVGFGFVLTEPEREFDVYGLSHAATFCLLLIFSAYLIARIQKAPWTGGALLVCLASTAPLMLFAAGMLRWLGETAGESHSYAAAWAIFLVWIVWVLAVVFRAVRFLYHANVGRAAALVLVYAVCNVIPRFGLPEHQIWYSTVAASEVSEPPRVNVEDTFDAQRDLLDLAVEPLAPERPGIADLYFVGFGGAAYQDVFMKEVRFVRQLFDDRFDTTGRSVMLINNRATVHDLPLASVSNLRRTLNRIARRIDRDEDVLFLFLTSHGSQSHVLSTTFWPLRLNGLAAGTLKEMLDAAGIKWRVLVVSACYSGGFIDVLKDENTLIMTASHADRQSFGCSNLNDFTYFGEAYFKQQLPQGASFVEAFHAAREAITEREEREGLTPSRPQIHVGSAIETKLAELESRLRTYAAERPATSAPASD